MMGRQKHGIICNALGASVLLLLVAAASPQRERRTQLPRLAS